MRSVRLLPVVIVAMSALLVLKGIGLVTGGGYVLTGTQVAAAQSAPSAATDAASGGGTDMKLTPSDVQAAKRASDALFSSTAPAQADAGQIDAVPYTENKAGEKVPLRSKDGVGSTERAVLERLSDRRAKLDQLSAALDQRQAIVAAAEKRLAERTDMLKALEAKINALVEKKKAMDDAQFKGLVAMYEAMKPKDAATIFDQLSMDVLLRVATAMAPRKMSPILAKMTPQRAQQLTVMMASAADNSAPKLDKPLNDLSSLPQIVGK